ncbi:MAG: single-stranded DNA-binding protein [Spirochaetales bacterium]|nr:single-stranded DNA-binding protein [Spirochaetales bacterium]
MEDVNYVIMIGRLTRDAELKYTNSGLAVSSFSLAVNRRKRSGESWEDEVSFFDLALFGKRAESLNQYLTKGQQVAVEGTLSQDRWEQDGKNRSKVKIIANNIQLLGGRGNAGGGQGGGNMGGNNQQGGGAPSGGGSNNGGYNNGGSNNGGYNNGGYNNGGSNNGGSNNGGSNNGQQGGDKFQPNNDYSVDFEDDIPF